MLPIVVTEPCFSLLVNCGNQSSSFFFLSSLTPSNAQRLNICDRRPMVHYQSPSSLFALIFSTFVQHMKWSFENNLAMSYWKSLLLLLSLFFMLLFFLARIAFLLNTLLHFIDSLTPHSNLAWLYQSVGFAFVPLSGSNQIHSRIERVLPWSAAFDRQSIQLELLHFNLE